MKNSLINILKITKTYYIAKKIQNKYNLFLGKGHGHSLLLKLIAKRKKFSRPDLNFIEIGSSREDIFGQGSTKLIATFCEKHKINFISIDADEKNVCNIDRDLKDLRYFKIINNTGENFSKNFKDKVDVIYLDAFDIETHNPPKDRVEFYKKKFNKDITNSESAKMHYEVVENLINNFSKNCLVVFDDTFINDNSYLGKGQTAIPLLLKNNFRIIKKNENSVALERTTDE
jgi:hypothetical protein